MTYHLGVDVGTTYTAPAVGRHARAEAVGWPASSSAGSCTGWSSDPTLQTFLTAFFGCATRGG